VIRILLVDDHASTREPLAFMLAREPDLTVVAQAGSFAEAGRAIAATGAAIDVAIVDLGLPDGAGEDLIPILRDANPDATSLVLTYFSDRERLARAVQAGATGVIHKSASFEEVVDAIRRVDAGEQILALETVLAALRITGDDRLKADERLAVDLLTERELEVLQALAEGLSDKEIAERLSVGQATVRTHVTNILAKLDAASRLQAVVTAVRYNIVAIA
jgi:DNA-binding NarL/FixJ family response regulator